MAVSDGGAGTAPLKIGFNFDTIMKDYKRLKKLLGLAIQGHEVESLLAGFGFVKRQGKGLHAVWFQEGFEPIVLARHGKEYKIGYLRQIIKVLRNGGLLDEEAK